LTYETQSTYAGIIYSVTYSHLQIHISELKGLKGRKGSVEIFENFGGVLRRLGGAGRSNRESIMSNKQSYCPNLVSLLKWCNFMPNLPIG